MAERLTLSQAYSGYAMKNPAVTAEIEKMIKAGQVDKAFSGDLDKFKGKKLEFIQKYQLISNDPTVQRRAGGGTRVVYRGDVDKFTNGAATKVHDAVKAINKMLKEHPDENAKHFTAFCYFKDDRAKRAVAPADAAGVAGSPAPTGQVATKKA